MATKNLVPRATNEGKIGTSTKKWNEVNATTVNADNIVTDLSNKVDKVSGKGLSTNDLTDALKTNYDAAYTQSHSNANDPSADQKAALAGSSGTPSGTNKYVTNDDSRNSDARTPTAHNQGADTINLGTLDGDRLPALSTTKKGGVPATGTPSGKYLKDDGTWAAVEAVVADESITNAKLAHIATATIKGRVTAATGDVEDLTAANVRTIINVEDGSTKYPDTGEQPFLDADHTKLDGIEAAADVTDAVNVAAAVHGVAAKSPLVDNDEIPIIDSEASNVLKKSLWSVVKSTLKTYFDTLYNLYVHPNHSGDVTSVADGAQTIAAKAVHVAMLADGTDGEIITWDADGVAATVAVGTATHVLTSNGVGAAPTFQAAPSGGSSSFPAGAGMEYFGVTEPTGWLFADSKTIGDASSGGTARDNADAETLFALLWAATANTELIIQDSSGNPTTRGASAAADFAAHKRMPLPDKRGRVSVVKDNMGGTSANRVTSAQADLVCGNAGAETHTLSAAELPAHDHGAAGAHTHTLPIHSGSGEQPSTHGAVEASSSWESTGSSGSHSHASVGSGTAHNNMSPYLVCNYIIKY